MVPLSHLNALRALEVSVRLGSFKAAADELGVTPAAVGQHVRNLEAALGQQLLIRRANGFEATQTAVAASEKLAAGFNEIRDAVALLTRGNAPYRIFLTITPSISERWLAPRLSNFLTSHPQINLRIDSTSQVHYQSSGEFDFAIRYDRPGKSGYEEVALFGEVLIPVCTPDVAERLGPLDRADSLTEAPLLHVDRSTDDPDWFHWDEWAEKFGYVIPKERQRLHIAYTTMALRSLYDGHGLHLAQLTVTLDGLISGRLVAPFGVSKCVRPSYRYSLIDMNADRRSSLQSDFRDWIVDEAMKTRKAMDAYIERSKG